MTNEPGVTRWYICGSRDHDPANCQGCGKPVRYHAYIDRRADGSVTACNVPGNKQAAA